jgi:selenide,water dikinase
MHDRRQRQMCIRDRISCAPEQEAEVLSILNLGGFASAQKIGQFVAGTGLSVN